MTREEAIKEIRSWDFLNDEERAALETLIPELRESEDEMIRKLLVWQVYRNIEDETNDLAQSVYDGIKGHDPDLEESIEDWKKCLAWLEKQKENPKSADSIPADCVSDAKCEDRWHKVGDSLPDNPREVLCKDEAGNYFIGRYYVGEGWEISNYDDEDKPHHLNPPVSKWIDFPPEKQKEQKEIPIMNGDADLYFDEWNQQNQNPTKRQCFEEGIRYAQRLQKEQNPAEKPKWDDSDMREDESELQTRFAFYTYKDDSTVLYLSNVFVEEASRNHGFGTRILMAAEKVAETIGATTICLKVKQDSPANAWYRKNGYGYVAFEDGYDWLEKNLEYMKPNKQEWSEEETKDLVHILKVLDDCYIYGKHDLSKTDYDNLTSTLKSLRPSWRPSEKM